MDGGTGRDVQRDKQHVFPSETERVVMLPDLEPGTRHTTESRRRVVVICRFFFCRPQSR